MLKNPFQIHRFGALFLILGGCVGMLVVQAGCSHKKTNRGHLFRCDWAFEYNRTPWIGCPPESGCDDERGCNIEGCKGCSGKGFRRHCGQTPECSPKKPCCRTLGCGMWIDPSDPNSFAGLGQGIKACGLTPFCSPMKPCCLTPMCGRVTMSPQTVVLGNSAMPMPVTRPALPTPTPTQKKEVPPAPDTKQRKAPTVAGPNGLLISMGIVPGVSMITNGGVVVANGVATPAGVMTPSGVQLPNGTLNNQAVLKACVLHPGCTVARPCGMSPGCGGLIPIAMVSNNATMLASAMNAPGGMGGVTQAGGMYGTLPGYVNGNIMQAGGMPAGRMGTGMLVNPITGQPVSGLSMTGGPQMGYPPIGYTPTGYSPRYPRFDGLGPEQQAAEEEEEAAEEEQTPFTKSEMPVPRFHPVPSKPAFQRSEGLPVAPKTSSGRNVSSNNRHSTDSLSETEHYAQAKDDSVSEQSFDAALERAYLEGMSAAMQEVEAELDAKNEQLAKKEMQAKVLKQAKQLQEKIDYRQQHQEEQLVREQLAESRARSSGERERRYREQLPYTQTGYGNNEPSAIQSVGFQFDPQGKGFVTPATNMNPESGPMVYQGAYRRELPRQQSGRMSPYSMPMNRMPQQENKGHLNQIKETGTDLLQSAKSIGNELLSPFNSLLEKGGKGTAPQVRRPVAPMPSFQRPVHCPVPDNRNSQVVYPPERQRMAKQRSHELYGDCEGEPVEMTAPLNASAPVQPLRPPTGTRKVKKAIGNSYESGDEDDSIKQALFVEPN